MFAVPYKTVYETGESVNTAADLVVYMQSTDGSIVPVDTTDFTVTPSGTLSAGSQTVTVTHTASSLTATYNVTVTAASGFTGVLLAVPIKTVYTLGESINKVTDLVVYRQSTDGGIALIAPADFTVVSPTGGFTSIGSQTVTIRHSAPSQLDATYTVQVSADGGMSMIGGPLLVSPSKTTYTVGES
ncbi:MAG: bacterial Ig-like domain-containing protein, partial [Spirochaetaceae bacterium]|nr:bacterial Ig-like domain-containing protein [Spirochaetaceae bacterium]